jgi:TRAP-type C4-dicarboxylate transport system permease small subunit
MLQKMVDRYCKLLSFVMVACLALMVVLVFGNVVLRYGFNSGLSISEEVSRWLFIWVTFLGAIVALRERSHLGSDMLVSRLPVIGKKICLVFGQLLMLFLTWLMFQGSLAQAKINWEVAAPVTGASMASVYGAGVVFAVSAGALLLLELVRTLSGQMADDELVMVKESEEQGELEALQAELAKQDGSAVVQGGRP